MADLFHKQADKYAATRPSYPPDLFHFIASNTPHHHLAWDVGTGSGQAAVSLAQIFDAVVATDTSPNQLAFAPRLPNIHYHHTPPTIPLPDLHTLISPPSSLDLITVAQALHWFDLPTFYSHARLLLRKPGGVLAAWCYTVPRVDAAVDAVFARLYEASGPFWEPGRRLVDGEYRGVEFPFEAVEGVAGTGPVEGFAAVSEMDLEAFLVYVRSWSSYQTARDEGVELLTDEIVGELREAWGEDGKAVRLVTYPIHLRIGRVGDGNDSSLTKSGPRSFHRMMSAGRGENKDA